MGRKMRQGRNGFFYIWRSRNVGVTCAGADGHDASPNGDAAQLRDRAQVDKVRRLAQALLQRRDQGLAAGQKRRIIARSKRLFRFSDGLWTIV
jgi:hypothetical protein